METANLNIRIDKRIKEEAEELYGELGLTMSGAINIFLRASLRQHGIPFALKLDEPNDDTSKAIEEGRRLMKDQNAEGFSNVEDLRKSLGV